MSSGVGPADLDIDAVLSILSRPDDVELAELVELVAKICDAEAAGITILRGDNYHVPVTYGIAPFVCPADDTFCTDTMSTDGVFCIEDATADDRYTGISWVDGTLASARFYASAPLYGPNGQMVGRLCVIDSQPKVLTPLQLRSLETLALSVTKLIELRLLRLMRSQRPVLPSTEANQSAATVVSQLAAELSHDMRVPLSSIVASLEMLEEELGNYHDPAVTVLLDRTTRAADRLVRMLDRNMEAGSAVDEIELTEVDLDALVRQLVLDSAALLETANATIETTDLPVVHAEPRGIYSVMQNLVTNSVKFGRPGVPAVVTIFAARTDGGWRVSVRDNGVGIPEDRRADVFALFSRGDTDVAGHGIGLATVARIIAAHGGHVGASSAPGGGTEIWFELPDESPEGGTGSARPDC
jgi:signal transduction histidine kinase